MIDIILCTIFGVFILLSYTLGLKFGQKLANKEEIKIIDKQPADTLNDDEEEQFDDTQEKIIQVLQNIEAYDGTEKGQKEVTNG